jgi:hypothetical protein
MPPDRTTEAPTGRKKLAQHQGYGRRTPAPALDHNSPKLSKAEAAKEVAPVGWVLKSVGELAAKEPNSITDGPFGSKLKTEHYTRSGPRVIRLKNVKGSVKGSLRGQSRTL